MISDSNFYAKILTLSQCSADPEPTFSEGNLGGNRAPCCAWSDQCRKHGWERLLGVLEFRIIWEGRERCREDTESHTPPTVLVQSHLSLVGSPHTLGRYCACRHLCAWTWTWVLGVSSVAHHGSDSPPVPPSPAPPPPAAPLSELERDTFSAPNLYPLPSLLCSDSLRAFHRLEWCGLPERYVAVGTCSLTPWFGVEWSEGLRGDRGISHRAVWRWVRGSGW